MSPALVSEQTGCTYDGMLAEYQVIDEMSVVGIPEELSFEEAATLPCAAVLAWSALTTADRPLVAGARGLNSVDAWVCRRPGSVAWFVADEVNGS